MEFAELPREEHPFFVGTQAHPEFRSRPTRAHPLFAAFIAAALQRAEDSGAAIGALALGSITTDEETVPSRP